MSISIIAQDDNGNLTRLLIETSYSSYTKDYIEEDGWVHDQLYYSMTLQVYKIPCTLILPTVMPEEDLLLSF
jgi:hypothetical protein